MPVATQDPGRADDEHALDAVTGTASAMAPSPPGAASATPRQGHLDSLRGIAAFVVVLVHYAAAFYPYAVFGQQNGYRKVTALEDWFFFPPLGIVTSGHLAVSLFFILSGYVLSFGLLGEPGTRTRVLAALAKRPVRLDGLALFSVVVAAALWQLELYRNHEIADLLVPNHWFDSFWRGALDPELLAYNMTMHPFASGKFYNTPLWTIQIELYGSMMVFLFVLVCGNRKYRLAAAGAAALLFLDSLYLGFWLGLITADLVKHHADRLRAVSGRAGSVTLAAVFLYLSSYPYNVSDKFVDGTIYAVLPRDGGPETIYPMIAAFCLFLLTVTGAGMQRLLDRPVLRTVGDISYALYAIHFLVLGTLSSYVFLSLFGQLGHHGAFAAAVAVGLPATILLSAAATRLVDSPAIRLSNRLGRMISSLLGRLAAGEGSSASR